MKKSVLHFFPLKTMRAVCLRGGTAQIIRCLSPPLAFYLCLSAFICGCFLSVSYASTPPANNVHICEILDYEAMRARDSIYAATKRAFDLDVGEPRTVRMIYFLPNDRPFQQAVVDSMKVTIRQIQTFFADQMEAHGYGRKTFRFETDAQGEPVVHRVDGQHTNSYYLDTRDYWQDISQKFDFWANNVYWTVWDNGTYGVSVGAAGLGGGGRDGGKATVSAKFYWTTVAHELGHAFGLGHDWRDGNYIMSYGAGGSGRNSLSACAAEFLSVHPYFNPDIPDEETPPPTIELISPQTYPSGSKSISIQLKVSDSEGLYQVLLSVSGAVSGSTVKACHGLEGERDAVVEFEYDGIIPTSSDPDGTGTSLSNPLVHEIYVDVVDIGGNVGHASFVIRDASTTENIIATLEGHTNRVYDVAFSPDGSILVSASRNHTIKLWDVATKREIATFRGGDEISFSPDGSILVSASRNHTIKLWDVATRENIATLEGHTSWVNDVVFSPDGSTLASAGGFLDHTVKLWDVATRENIATLEGHTDQVVQVTFSPDGSILASASEDAKVKLWDVMTRENIATFRGGGWSGSVSFSPDGSILAYGSSIHKLWDVASRREISTFGGYSREVEFSPDGSILASASGSAVQLWDVATRHTRISSTLIATLGGHTGPVHSVSFSPDGTMLASGSWDGTVKLWDASAIIPRPQPQTLVKVSGDKQKGAPGAVLETPLVVEVKDQNGNVLEGVAVMFSVTEGDGKLSVKTAMTDSSGRVQTMLTLGNSLETTIVAVIVPGIEPPSTFVIEAVATPDFDGDGTVGIFDFLLFVDQFGFSQSDAGYDARFDLDGNGVIGISDFLIFVNDFGKKIS